MHFGQSYLEEPHIRPRLRHAVQRIVALTGPSAPIVVVLVLAAISAFAVWSATETRSATAAVERARALDDLYERARSSVSVEAEADSAYRAGPGPDVRARYNAAATRLSDTLDRLGNVGESADRRTARQIAGWHGAYLQLDARLFAALDRGDAKGVAAIDTARTTRLFDTVRAAVDDASNRHRARVNDRIADLQSTTATIYHVVPAAAGFGMLLVALFASIMVAHRREAERAADAEIGRLARVAGTDNLTGLGNHRALHEEIVDLVMRSELRREPFAVLALDLDGLKAANDSLGHHEGDRLILQLGQGLLDTLPDGARAYRIGGDEFIATLPGCAAIDAFHYSQALQTTLAPPETGILAPEVGSEAPPTHVTVGVCDSTMAVGDAELLLHRADLALIAAKRTQQRGLIWALDIEPLARDDQGAKDHRRMLATALAKAVDAKDSYTRSHCETVSQLCVLIAQELGMGDDDIEQLRLAGLLHDVGKIGVPDAILHKPDGLTEDEFAQMQEHSTLGHSIVAAAGLKHEAEWVRHHHERVDGHGYPHRLEGTNIPLQSRIIFVADAFEAITSDRPYRRGRPASEALIELERCAGSQFDPDCVEALVRAMDTAGAQNWAPASARRLRVVRDVAPPAHEAA
ncbi:MAG: diguanylate cyclase [Thermoleophilia bacterium]|nr:diguanylate cyclase [Thermoleophilia bacterium]